MFPEQVVLGPLPEDFLRVNNGCTERQQQEQTDHAMAAQLQMMNRTQPVVGRLQVNKVVIWLLFALLFCIALLIKSLLFI
jgi:hypothetical protein